MRKSFSLAIVGLATTFAGISEADAGIFRCRRARYSCCVPAKEMIGAGTTTELEALVRQLQKEVGDLKKKTKEDVEDLQRRIRMLENQP